MLQKALITTIAGISDSDWQPLRNLLARSLASLAYSWIWKCSVEKYVARTIKSHRKGTFVLTPSKA